MRVQITDCADVTGLLQREWLETNGLGDYASGTLTGINTRRYHGWLVAEAVPGAGRRVLCAKVDETVFLHGHRWELGANEYEDTVHPQGYRYLTSFRLDPWPVWTWSFEGVVIERHLALLRDWPGSVVVYKVLEAPAAIGLELRPLVAGRDQHHTAFENWSFRRQVQACDAALEIQPYDEASRLVLWFPGGRFQGDGFWFYNFVYREETALGLDDREDLFSPGSIVYGLRPGQEAVLVIAPDDPTGLDVTAALATERTRRATVAAGQPSPLAGHLALAAEQFVIRRGGDCTVLAGYPWLDVWCRDGLIALPGLTAGLRDPALADCLLRRASDHLVAACHAPERECLGADTPLWLARAARLHRRAGGAEAPLVEAVIPALGEVVEAYFAGLVPGIWVVSDGLLAQGHDQRPLTWMDGWCDDWVVTPRRGLPVEINALWYTTMRLLEEAGQPVPVPSVAIGRAFLDRFWDPARGYLLDVAAGPEGDDPTFRPNQILAVSLDETLLPDDLARTVLDAVEARLLTPLGLRTLDPADPRFREAYVGSRRERDAAYHQGPAWPWLLGAFAEALLRCRPDGRERVRALLEPFTTELARSGLGQVSQLYDGLQVQHPRGCIAYALSVAELLRVASLV